MSNWPPTTPDQLDTISALIAGIPEERGIPTYDELSYDDFLHNHLSPNTPFLLSSKNTASWSASSSFRLSSGSAYPPKRSGCLSSSAQYLPNAFSSSSSASHTSDALRRASAPNLSALQQYGSQEVPIANTLQPQYSEFERTEHPLDTILEKWERALTRANARVARHVNGAEKGVKSAEGGLGNEVDEGDQGSGMYVKDWHLMAELEVAGKGVQEIYQVPECFRDDWLNPPYTPHPDSRAKSASSSSSSSTSASALTFTSTSTSDFRFTYLGPPLTYTPLHRDVYGSYSWSANVVGRKVWWLFPPSPEVMTRVKDDRGELVFDVRALEGEGGGIKILQQEGEIIFVPSGWHHQVVNLDFCISINHNFFASPTIHKIYAVLSESQERVEEAIWDVRQMIIDRAASGASPSSSPLSTSRPAPALDIEACTTHSAHGDDHDRGHGYVGGRDETKDPTAPEWEREWVGEVQRLLEMDAGWNWAGFWKTILTNLQRPPTGAALSPPREMRNNWISEVIVLYKHRREWIILDDVKRTVEEIAELLEA